MPPSKVRRGKKRGRRNKQQDKLRAQPREKKQKYDLPSPDVFSNPDLISIIMSSLDTPELLRLTFCNKTLVSALEYKHVVRSAMFHGARAFDTMECVYNLVNDRQIYIPSPQRMLRMVNAKQCEREGCTKNVWYHQMAYGVCFCDECYTSFTSHRIDSRTKMWDALMEEPWTANCIWLSSSHLWVRPYTDASGDCAGPILTIKDWNTESLDHLLEEQDAVDPHANDSMKIVNAFEESEDADKVRREDIFWRRYFEKQQEKQRHFNQVQERRLAQTYRVIDKLSRLLQDWKWKEAAVLHHYVDFHTQCNQYIQRWKSMALLHQNVDFRNRCTEKCCLYIPFVIFECKLVDEKMRPLLKHLSKAINNTLEGIAHEIRHDFELFHADRQCSH